VLNIYIDEDSIWRSFVEGLRLRGLDVLTAADADLIRYTVSIARTLDNAEMRNRCEFLSHWSG
jgi:hypothetical protein